MASGQLWEVDRHRRLLGLPHLLQRRTRRSDLRGFVGWVETKVDLWTRNRFKTYSAECIDLFSPLRPFWGICFSMATLTSFSI